MDTKPARGTKPGEDAKPAGDTKPGEDTKPAPTKPEPGGDPDDATPGSEETRPQAPMVEMTTYQFAMLKTGPNTGEPAPEDAAKMMKAHLEGLASLMKQRKAVAVGPVEKGGDLRGIVVFAVDSAKEVEKLLENDPYIRSGHMIVEIHPWLSAKGIFQEPKEFLDLESYWLGLLRRPKDAPELPSETKKRIQEGHMANIQKMAASGDLVVAGPFADDTALRGVFVFRGSSADHVRELSSHDPAIEAHRLEMDLLTWHLSKGVLPPREAAGAK